MHFIFKTLFAKSKYHHFPCKSREVTARNLRRQMNTIKYYRARLHSSKDIFSETNQVTT